MTFTKEHADMLRATRRARRERFQNSIEMKWTTEQKVLDTIAVAMFLPLLWVAHVMVVVAFG